MKDKLMMGVVAALFVSAVAMLTGCSATGGHEMMGDPSKTMHKETMQDKMMDDGAMSSGKADTMQ
jgi:hypothetical protein